MNWICSEGFAISYFANYTLMELAISTFQSKIKQKECPPQIKPKQHSKKNSSFAHFMKNFPLSPYRSICQNQIQIIICILGLTFFLIKTDRIYFPRELCFFSLFFSIVLGYLTPQATLHTSWLRAQLPSFF